MCLHHIFTSLYSRIKNKFLRHGCPSDGFDDYFQEALLIFYKRINKGKAPVNKERFIGTACFYLWMNDKKNRIINKSIDGMDFIDENDTEHNDIEHFLFYKHFKSLPTQSREIISLSLKGISVHEITARLQLPNDKATINKRHYWKKKLKTMILSDPLYKMNYAGKIPD